MKTAILLLAFLAVAFANSVSFTDLTLGSVAPGALSAVLTEDDAYNLNLYRVWIPENTSAVSVNFEVSSQPADCEALNLYVRTNGFPCGDVCICGGYLFVYAFCSFVALVECVL
jgi:hypothetical protein